MGTISVIFVVVGVVILLIGVHLSIASQPNTNIRRDSKILTRLGTGILIISLIITILIAIPNAINNGIKQLTPTPTPALPDYSSIEHIVEDYYDNKSSVAGQNKMWTIDDMVLSSQNTSQFNVCVTYVYIILSNNSSNLQHSDFLIKNINGNWKVIKMSIC